MGPHVTACRLVSSAPGRYLAVSIGDKRSGSSRPDPYTANPSRQPKLVYMAPSRGSSSTAAVVLVPTLTRRWSHISQTCSGRVRCGSTTRKATTPMRRLSLSVAGGKAFHLGYHHLLWPKAHPRAPSVIVLSCRIAGVAVGNVRVSDARLVEGRWVGLGFAARSPAGSPRTAAVVRGSPGELGKELGVGGSLAEAVEEHVDGLLAVPAIEGPAQGVGGYHFLGGQQ